MKIEFFRPEHEILLEPLSCTMDLADMPVGASSFRAARGARLSKCIEKDSSKTLRLAENLWPSAELVSAILDAGGDIILCSGGEILGWVSDSPEKPVPGDDGFAEIELDADSLAVKYPWDLLKVNRDIVSGLSETEVLGEKRENVSIDGNVKIGQGTVLLPGVYIEGNFIAGENCKIGPNCYIRPNTAVGDNCHIGQAVELKNSIIMDDVNIGHLSYVGDSIIAHGANLGAGTITANLRHDNANQRSTAGTRLVDTGLRKLGAIIGSGVHTGINTSFYPGRKMWPETITEPGAVIKKDVLPLNH